MWRPRGPGPLSGSARSRDGPSSRVRPACSRNGFCVWRGFVAGACLWSRAGVLWGRPVGHWDADGVQSVSAILAACHGKQPGELLLELVMI